MKKCILIISILSLVLVIGSVSTVSAHNIRSENWYNPGYAKTITKADWELTYNNYLYAETIGWSVDNSGNESFHPGPQVGKYNSGEASSQINVPWGRGTWFESIYEGKCNRCQEVMGYNKKMFAF